MPGLVLHSVSRVLVFLLRATSDLASRTFFANAVDAREDYVILSRPLDRDRSQRGESIYISRQILELMSFCDGYAFQY